MQLKRSQFLALAAGALMTPLLASCGAKGGAPSEVEIGRASCRERV